MGFRGFEDAEIVEEPTGAPSRVGPRPGVVNVIRNADGSVVTVGSAGSGATAGQGGGPNALAPLDAMQKARALSLFAKIPFLAAIALHPKVPGWIRAGAALLGAWEAVQIAQQSKDIEAMLPPMGP